MTPATASGVHRIGVEQGAPKAVASPAPRSVQHRVTRRTTGEVPPGGRPRRKRRRYQAGGVEPVAVSDSGAAAPSVTAVSTEAAVADRPGVVTGCARVAPRVPTAERIGRGRRVRPGRRRGRDSATGWRGASSSRTVDFTPTRPLRCDGGSAPVHAHGRSPAPARLLSAGRRGLRCIAPARLRLAGVTRSIRYGGRCDGPGCLSLAAVVPTAFDVVRAWAVRSAGDRGRGHRRGPLSVARHRRLPGDGPGD
jgi:hypothetical protein